MHEGPLDISSLRGAIAALADAVDLVSDRSWFDAQPEKVRNTLASGAVQCVEMVYELSIKTTRRLLEAQSSTPSEIDPLSYRDMVRVAAEKGLIDDVGTWFQHRELCNITSHTYDREKAAVVLQQAPEFLASARRLAARIEAANG